MNKVRLSKYLNLVFESDSKDYSEWFAYYNYDTLNHDQTKILCNRASFDGIKPYKGSTIELGYYDLLSGKWHHIDTTTSWNWQQGAMMQWLPGVGNENKVIYNSTYNGHNRALICDITTGEKTLIDWSIYGITCDGTKSISLEIERSHWCRAYHYESIANPDWEGRVVNEDGVFEIDLKNNTRKRIISIFDVINTDFRPYFDNCKHWLEHVMISPSSKRICFLHRFSPIDNVLKYETRLFIADIDGGNLQIIPGWELFSWSHFGWKGDDEFVVYTQTPYRYAFDGSIGYLIRSNPVKLIKNLFYRITGKLPYQISKLVHGKRHMYQLYKFIDNEFALLDNFESNIFNIDGHPSFTKDGRYMITDSYPDKKHMQRLIVFDTITKKSLLLGKFYANYHRKPSSCDLHPKLCNNNDFLVVDTAYDSQHHLLMFKLNWDAIKKMIS